MFRRKPYVFGSLALVIAAGAIAFAAPPAATQSAAQQEVETAPLANTQTPSTGATAPVQDETDPAQQHALMMKMALGSCFEGPADVAPETSAPIRFALDGEGRLDGVPEFAGPDEATAEDRRIYIAGVTALDRCTPFPATGAPSRFEAVFSGAGVTDVRRLDVPGTPDDTSMRRAALAVTAAADEKAEANLALSRAQRIEIQRRLGVLGFDPRGADGVFGAKTRTALSDWQADKGFAVTGYLNAVQLLALNAQSQASYEKLEKELAKAPKKKKKRRVRVCERLGILGIMKCHYEYR